MESRKLKMVPSCCKIPRKALSYCSCIFVRYAFLCHNCQNIVNIDNLSQGNVVPQNFLGIWRALGTIMFSRCVIKKKAGAAFIGVG